MTKNGWDQGMKRTSVDISDNDENGDIKGKTHTSITTRKSVG